MSSSYTDSINGTVIESKNNLHKNWKNKKKSVMDMCTEACIQLWWKDSFVLIEHTKAHTHTHNHIGNHFLVFALQKKNKYKIEMCQTSKYFATYFPQNALMPPCDLSPHFNVTSLFFSASSFFLSRLCFRKMFISFRL